MDKMTPFEIDEEDKLTFEYEEVMSTTVPNCMNCIYQETFHVVPPCSDCQGYWNTGKSYFKER